MATPIEVIDCIDLLSKSGLDYTPQDTDRLTDVWVQIFNDVPGETLIQAVGDYLRTETKWPAPARIRNLAANVKSRNGKSAVGNHFEGPSVVSQFHDYNKGEAVEVVDRQPFMVVTPDGWRSWQPGIVETVKLPAAYLVECARLEALDRLPTDDELYALEVVSGRVEG